MLCPAYVLGYLIDNAPPGERAVTFGPSFRAECPALLLLREASGHALEESLFDLRERNQFPRNPSHSWFFSHPASSIQPLASST